MWIWRSDIFLHVSGVLFLAYLLMVRRLKERARTYAEDGFWQPEADEDLDLQDDFEAWFDPEEDGPIEGIPEVLAESPFRRPEVAPRPSSQAPPPPLRLHQRPAAPRVASPSPLRPPPESTSFFREGARVRELVALVRQRGHGALDLLAENLQDPSPKVSEAAAHLLGYLGGPEALEILLQADQGAKAPSPSRVDLSQGPRNPPRSSHFRRGRDPGLAPAFQDLEPEVGSNPKPKASTQAKPKPKPKASRVAHKAPSAEVARNEDLPTKSSLPPPPKPARPKRSSRTGQAYSETRYPGSRDPGPLPSSEEHPIWDQARPELQPERATAPTLKLFEPLARNGFRALHRYTPHDPRELTEEELVQALLALVTNPSESPSLRHFGIKNLTRFPHPEVTPVLIDLLRDPLPVVRYAAAESLGSHGGKEALPHLLACLDDPEGTVRASAVHTLSQIGNSDLIRPFLKLRQDPDELVRAAVERALREVGHRRKMGALFRRPRAMG